MIRPRKTLALLICAVATLMTMAGLAQAQSSICKFYNEVGSEPDNVQRFLLFEADNPFLSGSVGYYAYPPDFGCITVGGTISARGAGWVYADSASDALAICKKNLSKVTGATVDSKAHYENFYICKQGSGGSKRAERKIKPTKPFVATGVVLNAETDLKLSAVSGLTSGIQFQRVGPSGVGIPAVLALGYLDAIDVWANIGGGYSVCFPQLGRVIFLDTAYTPRLVSEIDAYRDAEGYTCADMDRAGILVLVRDASLDESGDFAAEETADTPTPGLRPDDSLEIALVNCEITTVHVMRHRKLPAGVITGLVPAQTTLSASARTADWIRAAYEDRDGWIAAWLLTLEGDCDYPTPGIN